MEYTITYRDKSPIVEADKENTASVVREQPRLALGMHPEAVTVGDELYRTLLGCQINLVFTYLVSPPVQHRFVSMPKAVCGPY